MLQFKKSKIIIEANLTHNMYFKCLSYDWAWFMSNLVTNQYSWIAICCICFVLASISQIYGFMVDYNDTFYLVFSLATNGISAIFSILILLGSNIEMNKFTLDTFDFWYKMYNIIIMLITQYWCDAYQINYVSPIQHYWVFWINTLTIFLVGFVVDSHHVSMKAKRYYIVVLIFVSIILIIRFYFTIDNVYWNPFEKYSFKHTNIDIKGTYLSSYINLVLFVAKPLLRDIIVFVRNKVYSLNNGNIRDINIQRCYMIHKRPYLRWKHTEIASRYIAMETT